MTQDEARRAYAREYARQWRLKNRERHREYQRNYAARNREKENARKREWARNNPERVKLYRQRYLDKKALEMMQAQEAGENGEMA